MTIWASLAGMIVGAINSGHKYKEWADQRERSVINTQRRPVIGTRTTILSTSTNLMANILNQHNCPLCYSPMIQVDYGNVYRCRACGYHVAHRDLIRMRDPNPDPAMASVMSYYSLCSFTCAHFDDDLLRPRPGIDQYAFGPPKLHKPKTNSKKTLRFLRKPFIAECRAQTMLREMIGFDQWQVYRRTNRVIVFGKMDWIIGNVFGNYNKFAPLNSKPDVVRIDKGDNKRIETTYFCIDPVFTQGDVNRVPYTDKVLSYAVQCLSMTDKFGKVGNRIGERVFNKIPECAVFNRT